MIPYEFSAERFSRWMAYVLRHNPDRYGLRPDRYGFVDLEALLQIARRRYPDVAPTQLRSLIEAAGMERFEVSDNRVRARYGHSILIEPAGAPIEPPPILYHGTDAVLVEAILAEGLRPTDRRLLHLSETADEARAVASRKAAQPVVLQIDAQGASRAGVSFYRESKVFLVLGIPAAFIRCEPAPHSSAPLA